MGLELIGVALIGVELIGVGLIGFELIGLELIGVELIGVGLIGLELMGVALIGLELMGVALIGVGLMGVELIDVETFVAEVKIFDFIKAAIGDDTGDGLIGRLRVIGGRDGFVIIGFLGRLIVDLGEGLVITGLVG